ncbi:MAG: flagellin [Actinomycetota bacterium]|nr:flagellin [Actinomycetota bacterium]
MSSLVINTNTEAIAAYNNLNATDQAMSTAVNRLSSGLKVQTAADNASGYVISQFLTEQSNGLGQAISNGQDAVSVLQTASGAMNQITAVLQRMNQLATQAANGGATSTQAQSADNQEFQALMSQVSQIANTTDFGGTQLLNGSYQGQTFQLGAYNSANDQVTVSIAALTAGAISISGSVITNTVSAQAAMASIQAAISYVASQEAGIGAIQNQIQVLTANNTVTQQNVQSANSQIVDTNMAKTMTQYSADQILMQAGTAMLSQAQQNPNLVLKLLQ